MSKKKELFDPSKVEKLNIPEDEIWTYKIDGLQAPRIVDKSVSTKAKIGITFLLIISISLSIFFSIRAVSNDEFKFGETDSGIELVKYSNVENKTEITIDYAQGDKNKPVTELHEYAFNCDEILKTINLGKDIKIIDGKSFYYCKNLENIFVDDDNPYYCDIDGVLYTKDMSRILCYPMSHSVYLTGKMGYEVKLPDDGSITNEDFKNAVNIIINTKKSDYSKLGDWEKETLDKFTKITGVKDYTGFGEKYADEIAAYVLPSSVETIGKLAFAYSDIYSVYVPEGVKNIEMMAFFKAEKLKDFYSYTTDSDITETSFSSVGSSLKSYNSLPEGLETIGSDCFTYDRCITYMFVPSSIKSVGHHAFFNMCYKEDGKLMGLSKVNVALDEDKLEANAEIGESWLPKYDAGLFKKNVDLEYSSVRK